MICGCRTTFGCGDVPLLPPFFTSQRVSGPLYTSSLQKRVAIERAERNCSKSPISASSLPDQLCRSKDNVSCPSVFADHLQRPCLLSRAVSVPGEPPGGKIVVCRSRKERDSREPLPAGPPHPVLHLLHRAHGSQQRVGPKGVLTHPQHPFSA